MNTINDLIQRLIDVRDLLFGVFNDGTAAPSARKAALIEHEEVAHRIRILMSGALAQEIADARVQLTRVKEAQAKLEKALKEADEAAKVFTAVTKFLTAADRVIDLAKTTAKFA